MTCKNNWIFPLYIFSFQGFLLTKLFNEIYYGFNLFIYHFMQYVGKINHCCVQETDVPEMLIYDKQF